MLSTQIEAFRRVSSILEKQAWSENLTNIAVYPVAGFGSEIDDPGFIPVDPTDERCPLFHPATWNPKYRDDVVESFKGLVKTHHEVYDNYTARAGNKIAIYSLEPRNWQSAWLSRLIKMPDFIKYVKVNRRANIHVDFVSYYFQDYQSPPSGRSWLDFSKSLHVTVSVTGASLNSTLLNTFDTSVSLGARWGQVLIYTLPSGNYSIRALGIDQDGFESSASAELVFP